MRRSNRALWLAGLATCLGVAIAAAQAEAPAATDHPLTLRLDDLTWQKLQPELGERSSEMAILSVDPKTQATQLMIRVPKNFHLPKHWHTANETHAVIRGTFIIECEGRHDKLGQGSWNYMPGRMPHEAWTTANEGALLLVTVDSAWDVNWVGQPPKPEDFVGGRKK